VIDKETLKSISKLSNLRPHQQEKHYVQSLALTALAGHPLVFKGGTYLWFFHGLERFSEDLDFTATAAIPAGIDKTVSSALRMFGVENTAKVMNDDERSLSFRLSAKGPLYTSDIDLCHIYVEISRREKIFLPPVPLRLDSDAYQLPIKMLSGMSLDEVAAEKVRAVMTRDKARDLYDLFFLVKKRGVAFNAGLADGKLSYYGLKFSKGRFMEAMGRRQRDWKKELAPLVFGGLPEFGEVRTALAAWVEG